MKRICILLFTCSLLAYGQDDKTESTIQSWFDFNVSYTFNEQWKAYGDAGYRVIFNDNSFHRLYMHPAGSLRLNRFFTLHAGIGLSTNFIDEITLWEFRPFQGIEINWPKISSIPLTHYIRFEERFFSDNESSTFIFRWRYRLGTKIRFDENKVEKYFYIPLQLEWFINYGSAFDFRANQFRAVIGAGFVIDHSWRVEFNTIFQNLKATLEEIYTFNDIIFRFRIYKEINPGFDL